MIAQQRSFSFADFLSRRVGDIESQSKRMDLPDFEVFERWVEEVAVRLKSMCSSLGVGMRFTPMKPGVFPSDPPTLQRTVGLPIASDAKDCSEIIVKEGWELTKDGGETLTTQAMIDSSQSLMIQQAFAVPVSLDLRQPYEETQRAIGELLVPASLRILLHLKSVQLQIQLEQAGRVEGLFSGGDRANSLHQISLVIANWFDSDRVCVLDHSTKRMIASSTNPSIDKLSSQMIDLADTALGDPAARPDLHVERLEVFTPQARKPCLLSLTFERFGESPQSPKSLADSIAPHRPLIARAMESALRRSPAFSLLQRRSAATLRKRLVTTAFLLVATVTSLVFVPVTFRLPVQGTLQPATQHAVFATDKGIIEQVHVHDGSPVKEGDLLLSLMSPGLDRLQEQLQAELITAQAKLAATQSRRSTTNDSHSSQTEVIKSEIDGLHQQLQVLLAQQSRLTIHSPIEGTVRRWDKELSLVGQPVTHGQRLLTVSSSANGHRLKLEVPDHESGYLLSHRNAISSGASKHIEASQEGGVEVRFHIASQPGESFVTRIDQMEDSAMNNAAGKTVVMVGCSVARGTFESLEPIHQYANVIAEVDCGQRPLGFVLFRKLIEWTRSQEWF